MSQASDREVECLLRVAITHYRREMDAANVSDRDLVAFLGQSLRQAEDDLRRYAGGDA